MCCLTAVRSRINFKCSVVDPVARIVIPLVRETFIVTHFIREVVTSGRNTMEGTPGSCTRRVLV